MEMRTRGEVKAGGGAVLGTGVALRLSSALRGRGSSSKGVPPKHRAPGALRQGEEEAPSGARSRDVSRVLDTTSGPGRSPWGGGFRVAMIPPAASSEGGPCPPSSPHYFQRPSRPRWKSMVSFFLLPFQARCPVPAPPLSAGSFAQAQGSEWGVLRWGKGGRARSSGSCSPLPCATLASHPTPHPC